MMQMTSPTQSWVEQLIGGTKRELAEAVSRVAGLMPDNARIRDTETGQIIGTWRYGYWPGDEISTRCGSNRSVLQFHDNRVGQEWLWIADRSEAICLRP